MSCFRPEAGILQNAFHLNIVVCVSACLRVCMSACLRVCVCACLRVCVFACLRVCVFACLRECMCACVRVCACARVRVGACARVGVCAFCRCALWHAWRALCAACVHAYVLPSVKQFLKAGHVTYHVFIIAGTLLYMGIIHIVSVIKQGLSNYVYIKQKQHNKKNH